LFKIINLGDKMIAINILNYKNYKVTIECVNSILENEPNEEYHIFIIDNGSDDESVYELRNHFTNKKRVSVHETGKNLGFAAGNDFGIKLCEKQGIKECILSNSDIIFRKNSIDKLLYYLRNIQDAVIVGPKVLCKDGKKVLHSSTLKKPLIRDSFLLGTIFPSKKLDEQNQKGVYDVYSVSGCCFAINIKLFRNMGAFDKNTFFYHEEAILGMQALNSGYGTYIVLDTEVIHNHGASSGHRNEFTRTEFLKSKLYYWKKYRNKSNALIYIILYEYIFRLILLKIIRKENIDINRIRQKNIKYLKESNIL
jgi:hypothetical protein